jgi:predicted Ser/Thr protein kinase
VSVWGRVRGWLGGTPEPADPASEAQPKADEVAPAPQTVEAATPSGPAQLLASCTEDRAAIELYDEVVAELGEARAIVEARRALTSASLPALRVRVARTLDARGDDEGVEALLSRMPEGPEIAEALVLEAWARRADVAERRNDADGARVLWERVLARDVGYPRARERVTQLRGGTLRRADAGATVMAEGALTRGRYRVVRELGRGGAGTVFFARDVTLDRDVALKVYHRRGRADRERLLHEAKVPATLEHPGVVRVLDADLELFAIAMELTEGSVKDAARPGELPIERVLGWARSLTSTLSWLHARGLVHRDLKPSNLLLRRDRVVLTDFGLATPIGATVAAATVGGGEGTAGYMPPEQRRGDPASFAMDVYALGVSLEEMLAWADVASRPAALGPLIAAMRAAAPTSRPTLEDVRRVIEQTA